MKNIKQLFCGIVIGAVAAVSVTALAEYVIVPNSFPVKVNGQTVQVEGYNINDSTYFKLRDVADAVGGFDVDFVDGTIMVKSENIPAPTVAPITSDVPVASVKNTPNPKLGRRANLAINDRYGQGRVSGFSSDGLPIVTLEDGKQYVDVEDIEDVYNFKSNGYGFGTTFLSDKDYNIVIDNILHAPDNIKNNTTYIELQYYQTTLIVYLQNNCL